MKEYDVIPTKAIVHITHLNTNILLFIQLLNCNQSHLLNKLCFVYYNCCYLYYRYILTRIHFKPINLINIQLLLACKLSVNKV